MRFEFATATRIVVGAGALNDIGKLVASFGSRALVVTGRTPERAARLLALLRDASIEAATFSVPGEPTIALAQAGVAAAHAAQAHMIISFGGGSVLDAGKAIAALATNPGDPLDYLEVVGAGKPLVNAPLPFVALPTTSGTGSEVTRNAVLMSPEHQVKVSLRSPLMLARLALIDPELTRDLPPDVTASTGMDALTQVLEPFVSALANPITDALAREGLIRAARSLRRACTDGHDLAAREDMAVASLLSGLSLANAGLGAVHGFAAPLGGMFPIPHGVACARLLPFVYDANVRALSERAPDDRALSRFDEVARILTARPDAVAYDGVAWLHQLSADLAVPPLSRFGVQPAHVADVVAKAAVASSMKGNPIRLEEDELTGVLLAAL